MKKLLIIIAFLAGLTAIALASGWWWLTRSEGGAEWALNRAAGAVDELTWTRLDGSLVHGLEITGLTFGQAGTRITVGELEVTSRIHLLSGPLVSVRRLRARDVAVHSPAEPRPEAEAPGPFDPSALASPVAIDIRDAVIERLAIHTPGNERVDFERIALAGHYGERIELATLEVTAPQGSLSSRGHWELSEPFAGELNLTATTAPDEAGVEQAIELGLTGRLDNLEVTVTARGPLAVSGSGQVRGLPGQPSTVLRLEGRLTDYPGLELSLSELTLAVEGRPTRWSASATARVEGFDLPPGRWAVEANGGLDAVEVTRLRGDILDGEISGNGQLAFGEDGLAAEAELALAGLDLTLLYPDWPNQARLGGELAVRMDGNDIHLENLELAAPPTTLRVAGSGRINPADDQVALDLTWEDFTWPPITDDSEPLIASESGRMRLDGRISDWRLELDALLEAGDVPPAEVGVRARGNDQQARIESLELTLAEAGSLTANGALTWAPAPGADLHLIVRDFDPGRLVRELPGRVNARLDVRAEKTEHWVASVDLEQLDGQLRGQILEGSGSASMTAREPGAAQLTLRLGDNHLAIDSSDGALWRWQLEAGAIDQLWPGLAGTLELEGELQPDQGRIAAEGRIADGTFGSYQLERGTISADLVWRDRPRADLRLTLNDLDLNPWDRIDQLELTLAGGCDNHQLALVLAGRRGSVDLAAQGTLHECLKSSRHWQGRLERLFVGETVAGNWRLDAPLSIEVSAAGTRAGAGCLVAAGEPGGRLCLESLELNDNSRAIASIEQVPMDLLLLPLDPVVSLTTPLSGRIDAAWRGTELTEIAGQLRLDTGALRPLGGERDLLRIESVALDFTPGDERGVVIDLLARLEGNSELRGHTQIVDLRELEAARIDGEAHLNLPDISAFGHLAPEFDDFRGRMNGDVRLTGALLAPDIDGRLRLQGGILAHAPLGLNVRNITLGLEGTADRATLTGSAISGEGRLQIDGTLQSTPRGYRVGVQLDGESFQFADTDWLQVTASPKLSVETGPDEVKIDGDIHIVRLRGGLPPGTGERIRPSEDVEVLGEDYSEKDEAAIARRRITGRLGIHLGDNASLSAVGLRTLLAGALELRWQGDPEPRPRGIIRLPEGSYRAYGQTLEISNGQILFTGHPIDDPRLDIRAIREIFGDPRVEVAGVHIRGSAREPEIDLFTDPPTSKEKALAYVVTGADFDHASGQGAVNVGFYLLPKLFVSYGIGLFEAGNVLSGRYELSRRWGVRVVSGERDTGVDLSYTINN